MQEINKKEINAFKKLINDFVSKYEQKRNNQICYLFAGSISLNLLAIAEDVIRLFKYLLLKNYFRPVLKL